MAEPEPVQLDTTKPKPRKPPAKGGTVSPIKKAVPADKGVVVEKVVAEKATPVKKAAPKKATPKEVVLRDPEHPYYTRRGFAPVKDHKLYEATGGSGQIAVRSKKEPVTVGLSVSDSTHPREADRLGCVFDMYPTEEAAEKQAVKFRAQGLGAVVVPAQPYRGQPGDPK